jgi:hypothetical protein
VDSGLVGATSTPLTDGGAEDACGACGEAGGGEAGLLLSARGEGNPEEDREPNVDDRPRRGDSIDA